QPTRASSCRHLRHRTIIDPNFPDHGYTLTPLDPALDAGLVLLAQCDIAGQCVDVACGVDPGARGRFCCDLLRCPFGCAPVTVLVAACPLLAGAASGLAHFRGATDDAARLGPLDRRFPCQPLGAAALVVACRAAREVPCVLA